MTRNDVSHFPLIAGDGGGGSIIDVTDGADRLDALKDADGGAFQSTLGRALSRFRADGVDAPALHSIEQMGQRMDSMLAELREDKALRADAADPNAGLLLREELVHVYEEVLREPGTPTNAMRLFPQDRGVAPGANTHRVKRLYKSGRAVVFRGVGQNIPIVGMSQKTMDFPVRHYVTSFLWTLWEEASAGFANFALVRELLETARDVINEFLNLMSWFGSEEDGVYGVFNYPWLPEALAFEDFGPGFSASTLDILAELHRMADYVADQTKSTVRVDRMVTSGRIRRWLFNTPMSVDNSKSIGAMFLEAQSNITAVEEAWECQGVGPAGSDAMLFYRADRRGIQNVMVQGFTTLPAERRGFSNRVYAYASHGGVVLRDPISCVLFWLTYLSA